MVFLPKHRQRDVLALELVMDRRPVGLGPPPMPLLGTGGTVQALLQHRVGHLIGKRPGYRRSLRTTINDRVARVADFLPVQSQFKPRADEPKPPGVQHQTKLRLYLEDDA